MENRKFLEKVYTHAEQAYVTGAFPEWYSETFDLPSNFEEKRVLDLCSGMSTFSETVYNSGGNPIAVDFNYSDFKTLADNFQQTFLGVMEQDPNPDINQYQEAYLKHIQLFVQSLDQHPFLYLAASATHLPIRSNSIDFVISRNGLFGTLDTDFQILQASVNEAIRVVKKGGTIQLAPTGKYRSLSPDECRNQNRIITQVQNNPRLKVSLAKKPYNGDSIGVLTITKKK